MKKILLIIAIISVVFTLSYIRAQANEPAKENAKVTTIAKESIVFKPGMRLNLYDKDESGNFHPVEVISEPQNDPYALCQMTEPGISTRSIFLNGVKIADRIAYFDAVKIVHSLINAGICHPEWEKQLGIE